MKFNFFFDCIKSVLEINRWSKSLRALVATDFEALDLEGGRRSFIGGFSG